MGGYLLYTTASEDEIAEGTAVLLEKLLDKHYRSFRNNLILGIVLIILGICTISIHYSLTIILLTLGAVLIIISYNKKVYVEEADVVLYPVLALPYGDFSKSALIDLYGEAGEDVSFKISRIDLIKDELNQYLAQINNLMSLYENPDVASDLTDFIRVSEEGDIRVSFEEDTRATLEMLLKKLKEKPYDEFSFKLFESRKELSLHPSQLAREKFIVGANIDKWVEDYSSRINSLFESLKVYYKDILERVMIETDRVKELALRHYGEIEGLITRLEYFMNYSMDRAKVRVCPYCLTIHKDKILRSTYIPELVKNAFNISEGYVEYVCPECGSIYLERLFGGDVRTAPLKKYQLDILQSKTWSNIYVSKLDEINRFISETRRLKRDKYHEILRYINTFYDQFRALVTPIYMEFNKIYNEVEAHKLIVDWTREFSSIIPLSCFNFTITEDVRSVKKIVEDLLVTREEIIKPIEKELEDKSKPKMNIIFNESIIEMLVEAYEKMNQPEKAGEIRSAFHEKKYEELIALLQEVKQ